MEERRRKGTSKVVVVGFAVSRSKGHEGEMELFFPQLLVAAKQEEGRSMNDGSSFTFRYA